MRLYDAQVDCTAHLRHVCVAALACPPNVFAQLAEVNCTGSLVGDTCTRFCESEVAFATQVCSASGTWQGPSLASCTCTWTTNAACPLHCCLRCAQLLRVVSACACAFRYVCFHRLAMFTLASVDMRGATGCAPTWDLELFQGPGAGKRM